MTERTRRPRRRARPRRAEPDVIDADVVNPDWRDRAEHAPKMPAADLLRLLGLQVPDNVTAAIFVDSTERDGSSVVLVLRPIPDAVVDVAKATVCGLWGRLGSALPFLLPYLGPVLSGVPWFGGKKR
jgi:hypothetical protein